MRRRGRAKENGSTGTWLVLGGGLALLGIGVYLVTRSPSSGSASTSALAPSGGGVRAPALGDPTDSNSVAYACNACFKLNAIGHPNEAAPWGQKCTAGGGTVPTTTAQMYT